MYARSRLPLSLRSKSKNPPIYMYNIRILLYDLIRPPPLQRSRFLKRKNVSSVVYKFIMKGVKATMAQFQSTLETINVVCETFYSSYDKIKQFSLTMSSHNNRVKYHIICVSVLYQQIQLFLFKYNLMCYG